MWINVVHDPANISATERFEVGNNVRLLDWLIDNYGTNGFEVPTDIYKGSVSQISQIGESYDELNQFIAEDVYIIHRPQGAYIAVAVIVAILVVALIPTPTIPNNNARQQKKSPNNDVSGQTNRARPLDRVPDIFGTEKSYPDLIAPTVTEYINQEKFLTDWMVIGRGFFDIPSSTIKTGDTPIDDIFGSTVTFYEPGTEPALVLKQELSNEVKGQILKAPNSQNVTGDFEIFYDDLNDVGYFLEEDLTAFDNLAIGQTVRFTGGFYDQNSNVARGLDGNYVINNIEPWIYLTPIPFGGGITITDKFQTIIRNSRIYALLYVQEPVPHNLPGGWGGAESDLFQIANISGFLDPVSYAGGINLTTVTQTVMYEGVIYTPLVSELPFTTTIWGEDKFRLEPLVNLAFSAISFLNVSTVDAQWLLFLTEDWVRNGSSSSKIEPLGGIIFIGAFIVPGGELEEIWLDFQNPKGLAKGSNLSGTNEVDLNAYVEEVDSLGAPTGFNFNYLFTISDNERNPRFWTIKINQFNSSLIVGRRYRVSVARTNNESQSLTNLSETQWSALSGINSIDGSINSGTTRVLLTTRATEQVAALQEKQLNMITQRKVVTWNGVSVVGDIETGVGLTPSNRFADIMLHYMLDPDLGQRNESNIDIDALYAIQTNLDAVFSGEKGEFNYTFDSKSSPAIEEMISIAQAVRTFITREGSFFSFIRDEPQVAPKALFNRRNKKPESESRTVRFNKPQDDDGIIMEYIDSRDYKSRTITLPNDLPIGDPNYGLPVTTNPKKLESNGIKNYSQAWDRAQYEFNKLIYQRQTLKTTVTQEAIFLPLNSRVLHIDGLRLDDTVSDGEVVGVDGLTITTSERCIFAPATNYTVFFRDEDGTPNSIAIPVNPIPTSEFGFILTIAPPFPILVRGDNGYQKGTLYSFAEDGTSEAADSYLIQRKTPQENLSVELELINYDSNYFAADNQIPPPKD